MFNFLCRMGAISLLWINTFLELPFFPTKISYFVEEELWGLICLFKSIKYQMYSKDLFSSYRLCRATWNPYSLSGLEIKNAVARVLLHFYVWTSAGLFE